ncbi:hypothetical protein D9M73_128820 [compost metagenome]
MRGAQGGLLPCAIAVEAQDRHFGQPPQPFELRLGQRGAERRDCLAKARLRQRDHVHITLDHQHPPGLARGRRGLVEIVERAAFVE